MLHVEASKNSSAEESLPRDTKDLNLIPGSLTDLQGDLGQSVCHFPSC